MPNNATHAVNQPSPYPNVVVNFNQRILTHIATITGANGSATVNQLRSSAGIGVTYVSEGVYTITFPAAPTGSIGWALVCPPQTSGQTVADTRMYAIDSDTVNYVTGRIDVTAVDGSATPIVSDVIGDFTCMIFTLSP